MRHTIVCAVIKPIYGAASIGVVKVEDMEDLKATYKRVAKEMAGARIVDGAMQAGAADDNETDQVLFRNTFQLDAQKDPKRMVGACIADGAMQAGAADDDETDPVGQVILLQLVERSVDGGYVQRGQRRAGCADGDVADQLIVSS